MKLSLLVFPLLALPAANAATCKNCGGADKTSAKRVKMPNKSVFTRLAGIELMEIFEITHQIDHEVCAQQCDARFECAAFEYLLPNKLCVLASEYARISEDLAKGAFETIVFVKVRGKFTKAFPKDKETCLDKAEYEDYVNNEVDKWLNPSPKKTTSHEGNNVTPTEQPDTTHDSHSTSEGQYSGSGTEVSATPSTTYENEEEEAAHTTYDPSTTILEVDGETPSVAASTTSATTPAETSLPNYPTTVAKNGDGEDDLPSTQAQSSSSSDNYPLRESTTLPGDSTPMESSETPTDSTPKRILSSMFHTYIILKEGDITLGSGDDAGAWWMIKKRGEKVAIESELYPGQFLRVDSGAAGLVSLSDKEDSFIEWTETFNEKDSTWVFISSDGRILSARQSGSLRAMPANKHNNGVAERFHLEQ